MAVNGKRFRFSPAGSAKLESRWARLVKVAAEVPGAEAVRVEDVPYEAAKRSLEFAIADSASAFLMAHGYRWDGRVEKKIPGL